MKVKGIACKTGDQKAEKKTAHRHSKRIRIVNMRFAILPFRHLI